MTLTLALRTAQSGLLVNQAALDAVANNIANVNSVGYSRKVVNLEQRVVAGVGAGVQLSDVVRKTDEGLLKSLRLEYSDLNEKDSKDAYFARMQELFGGVGDNNSLSHTMRQFSSAMEALAVSPNASLEMSEAIRQGNEVAITLRSMTDTIQELRQQADKGISDAVTELNELITNVGTLNAKIIRNAAVGHDVTDLRDQRDLALDEMSKLIDIRYFYRSDGDVVVFTSNGRTMVDNVPLTLTHAAASTVASTATHAEGDFGGLFIGPTTSDNDVTTELASGQLKGLVDLRDSVLTDLQSQIDELSSQLRDEFNRIHNQGSSFPGIQTMTGTRALIDPAVQTITFSGTTDSRLILFDSSGDQTATTTVRALVGGAGPVTVDAMNNLVQTWLQANGAAGAAVSAATGKLSIALNTTTRNLAIRDEATANTAGATHSDATIQFDANGDTVIDETVSGFSNFFGLNDFFVDNLNENIHESNVVASTWTSPGAIDTLTFYDSNGLIATPLGAVAIAAGSTLTATIAAINTANIGVTAAAIPDGAGFRLRVASDAGRDMVVTQGAGDTILTELGMHFADVRVATNISVRTDIINSPSKVTRGAPQWDANLGVAGEYFSSVGDDSVAKNLAEEMSAGSSFSDAGGLSTTIASFEEYASGILSRNASLADTNTTEQTYQRALVDSLQYKSDTFRGVNLDEEMSNLILYENAYAAAARVVAVIQDMFDTLERTVL